MIIAFIWAVDGPDSQKIGFVEKKLANEQTEHIRKLLI
jgi:hypothetical protein